MPIAHLVKTVAVEQTARVLQLEGLFEIPPSQRSVQSWEVSLPIEDLEWNVGLVVGPSGSGKSTVARELFGSRLVTGYDWPRNRSILDGFPAGLSIKEIALLLSSVGFSSPPSWLRPFAVLSQGEQFRATLARALAEPGDLVVIDEFTSVVDRQVARIGSAAVARAIRRHGSKLIAVSCHRDIGAWLQPDWVLEMPLGRFTRRPVRPCPALRLEIRRVGGGAWQLFKQHHYLDGALNRAARCFMAWVGGRPAAFASALYTPHPRAPGWREHRTVCLPDFQGVGIGNALSEFVASLFAGLGARYTSVTGNPAMIRHRARSPLWHMHRPPSRNRPDQGRRALARTRALAHLTAGFRYVGPGRRDEALRFGLREGVRGQLTELLTR